MKRSDLTHGAVFDDQAFALSYAKHHKKMTEKFGRDYSWKLKERGFCRGKILDAGCGAGGMNIVLAKEFPESEVFGIDLSDILLDLARQSAEEENLEERVKFEKADVLDIPFENEYFDVVLNLNMMHLVNDPIKMLNEIERVTKPGGFIFIADLKRSWLGLLEKEIKSAFSLQEAKEYFSQSNIKQGEFSTDMLWWRFES